MRPDQTDTQRFGKAIRWLYHLDSLVLFEVVLAGVLNATLAYELILGNSRIINEVAVGARHSAITTIMWTYAGAIVLTLTSIAMQRAISIRSTRDNEQLKIKMFSGWQTVGIQRLESADYFGGMMKADSSFRYSGGVSVLCNQLLTLSQRVLTAVTGALLVVSLLFKGNFSHPFVAWWTLGVLTVLIVFALLNIRGYRQLTRTNVALYKVLMGLERKMNYFLMGIITKYDSLKAIKLWGLAPVIQQHYHKTWADERSANEHLITNGYQTQLAAGLLTWVPTLLIFTILFLKIVMGIIAIGQVNTFFGAITQLTAAVSLIVSTWQQFLRFENQMAFVWTNIEDSKAETAEGQEPALQDKNEIEFKDVSFVYEDGREAIANLSFKLSLRGTTALIGANGSGKSTLVKLLLGLYKPTTGKILFNGTDLAQLNQRQYQGMFKAAFQNFEIFDIPIAENIAASTEYTSDRLTAVAKGLSMEDWINALPARMETVIGSYSDSNFEPSGGQQQQIALARSAYKNGVYQVLDEPTSALDPLRELAMFTQLQELSADAPSLFVTHRVGAAGLADEIMLLRDGRLVDRGTKDELLKRSDYFRELWEKQSKMYES
ncbi:ATP-binding cassette domain-containing protein [Lacticaseibacillus zhaodongensis]|uniref:ATP-binding cassette domain-containing protein n=1 Tax=Lacticaseibacillus zhaodongensis TaxID=2668065 RepID=UPI0012D2FFF0|nr:ABC transporter ATP-binding protein [Lacticaseibacillus zhaodongensis]